MTAILSVFLWLSMAHAGDLNKCTDLPGSLPYPDRAAGTEDAKNPIKHILVIMQENHSFDNYFGGLSNPKYYGKKVDGVRDDIFNIDSHGNIVYLHPEKSLCLDDPSHDWNAEHAAWNGGKIDGFLRNNESRRDASRVLGYYSDSDIPYYYALANQFAISDRYFCSILSQTVPNRLYLYSATSAGLVDNFPDGGLSQKTIFDELNEYKISWKYYGEVTNYLNYFPALAKKSRKNFAKLKDYEKALMDGTLPQVVFLESSVTTESDEHPNENIQIGQEWVAKRVNALLKSPAWKDSVLFLTYDENGGFFDHVAPPAACKPDNIEPKLEPVNIKGSFDRYGFRVPFVAISPYAKHHYVSHVTYDHTSILKFIEKKFNLPALTYRDANAGGLEDLFDFAHPILEVKPLPEAIQDPMRKCK